MKETIEVIRLGDTGPEEAKEASSVTVQETEEPDYILRTQLLVCLFIAGVVYFAWRQGGEVWRQLSVTLTHILEDGVSFSGQEELTRFTDEVRGLFGELVAAFLPVK